MKTTKAKAPQVFYDQTKKRAEKRAIREANLAALKAAGITYTVGTNAGIINLAADLIRFHPVTTFWFVRSDTSICGHGVKSLVQYLDSLRSKV